MKNLNNIYIFVQIDLRRANNTEIMLTKVKMPLPDMMVRCQTNFLFSIHLCINWNHALPLLVGLHGKLESRNHLQRHWTLCTLNTIISFLWSSVAAITLDWPWDKHFNFSIAKNTIISFYCDDDQSFFFHLSWV